MLERHVEPGQQFPYTGDEGHIFGVSHPHKHCQHVLIAGLSRVTTMAALDHVAWTYARPPRTLRFPCSVPLLRLSGATPTSEDMCLSVAVPNSDTFASTIVMSTGSAPRLLRSRSSVSRHTGLPKIHIILGPMFNMICFWTGSWIGHSP